MPTGSAMQPGRVYLHEPSGCLIYVERVGKLDAKVVALPIQPPKADPMFRALEPGAVKAITISAFAAVEERRIDDLLEDNQHFIARLGALRAAGTERVRIDATDDQRLEEDMAAPTCKTCGKKVHYDNKTGYCKACQPPKAEKAKPAPVKPAPPAEKKKPAPAPAPAPAPKKPKRKSSFGEPRASRAYEVCGPMPECARPGAALAVAYEAIKKAGALTSAQVGDRLSGVLEMDLGKAASWYVWKLKKLGAVRAVAAE